MNTNLLEITGEFFKLIKFNFINSYKIILEKSFLIKFKSKISNQILKMLSIH